MIVPGNLEYGLQRPTFFNGVTAALAVGTSDTVLFSIPLNEIWEVHAAGIFLSTGAVAAQLGSLFVGQPSGVAVPLGAIITLQTTQRQCVDRVMTLPPGGDIVVQVLAAGLNDVVTVRMLAYKFPRAYFGRFA
jgi:hypothetical protein